MKVTLQIDDGAARRQVKAAQHLLCHLVDEQSVGQNDYATAIFVPAFMSRSVGDEPDAPALAFWLRDEDTSMGFSEEFWFGTTTLQGTPVYSTEGGPDEPAFWLPEGA